MQPSPPRCGHPEDLGMQADICTLWSTTPFCRYGIHLPFQDATCTLQHAFPCLTKIFSILISWLKSSLCMLLNFSLKTDFSSWMVEFQCRRPLVMQYSSYWEWEHALYMCSHVTAVLLLSLTSFKVSKSHEPAQILQRNPLLSEGTHIIIPLTTFEEHVSILHHVSCPDKRADNQALIAKYFVKLHQKTLYPCIIALVPACLRHNNFIPVNCMHKKLLL